MIHIILSVDQGVKDLPLLLSTPSKSPENTEDNSGLKNYGVRPLAVGVGGGYNDEMFNEMKAACKDVEQGVVWVKIESCLKRCHDTNIALQLRADVTNSAPMPSLSDTDAFGLETARRVKKKLNELRIGEDTKEGVYFFT